MALFFYIVVSWANVGNLVNLIVFVIVFKQLKWKI